MNWRKILKMYIKALAARRSFALLLVLFVAVLLIPLVFGAPSVQLLGGGGKTPDPDPFGGP